MHPSKTVAGREVKEALESNDLERFAELLSPDVHWGTPGVATPACQNRETGPAVVRQGPRGRAPASPPTAMSRSAATPCWSGCASKEKGERWQVLRVGPEGVNDIRGFEDRAQGARGLAP